MRGTLELLLSLGRQKRLIKDFVVRDLKARYVGSSMGFFWSVVFPIINLFVFMFVFRFVLSARWGDTQGSLEVAVVMLAGIVVWTSFAETISRGTNSLVENANLIQKVVFPSEVLPVYLTISSLVNMCIGLPVVLLCVLLFSFVSPPDVELWPNGPRGSEVERIEAIRLGPEHWHQEEVGNEGPEDDEFFPIAPVEVMLTRGARKDVVVPVEVLHELADGTLEPRALHEATIPRGELGYDLELYSILGGAPGPEVTAIVARAHEPSMGGLAAQDSIRLLPPEGGWPDARGVSRRTGPRIRAALENYKPLDLTVMLLFLPVLLVLQAVFTTGLCYFLSTFNLFLRDTYHLVGVGITVWMFGTPIFYPAYLVQKKGYGLLLELNPMHWLIEGYRDVLLYGSFPDPRLLGQFVVVALGLLLVGGAFFAAQKRRFPDLL